MSMLVSSSHPAEAGLQAALAETLLDYGAALDGPGSKWQSALMTALAFGYLNTAEMLARRGAPVDNIAAVAGLGRLEDTARLLPGADRKTRHIALALAAQHGQVEILRLLLDAGEDPSRYNPEGFHSIPLRCTRQYGPIMKLLVKLLVERGARLDVQDTVYSRRHSAGQFTVNGKQSRNTYAMGLRERDAKQAVGERSALLPTTGAPFGQSRRGVRRLTLRLAAATSKGPAEGHFLRIR